MINMIQKVKNLMMKCFSAYTVVDDKQCYFGACDHSGHPGKNFIKQKPNNICEDTASTQWVDKWIATCS